jgi:hypothetical protein
MTEQYVHQDYPRMIYQKGGGYAVVASEEEEMSLKGEWSRDPSPEIFSQFSSHHTTRVPVQDPSRATEQPQQSQSNDIDHIVETVIRRLQERDLLRRPPGRPPGS